MDYLGHDGDSLAMDGTQTGVLKQTNLAGPLKSYDSRALEAQISLEVLRDLWDQTLEKQLADQQFGLNSGSDRSLSELRYQS